MPNYRLYADSSLVSDHCPLILATEGYIRAYRGFRFETFWIEIQGFREEVQQVWSRNLTIQNPFLKLYTKLQRTTKRLRGWARGIIGNNKLLMLVANQLITILDVV